MGIRGHCLEVLNLLKTLAILRLFRSPSSPRIKNPSEKINLLVCDSVSDSVSDSMEAFLCSVVL